MAIVGSVGVPVSTYYLLEEVLLVVVPYFNFRLV